MSEVPLYVPARYGNIPGSVNYRGSKHLTEMCSGFEAGSYSRTLVSLSLRLKEFLGPGTIAKKR